MSKTVDERVVDMRFNNQQFEKNIKESMNSLDKFKKSLNLSGAAQGLENIGNAAKNVSFSAIQSGIEALEHRFSTFGIVGMRIIQNLTDSAMNMLGKISNFTIGGVVQGGISRAMNIEQAKFQLAGLQVEWDKISKDINYGVKDTAYGLDAAAVAASQLVASGVEFGETFGETGNSPMAKALRGISGVAAMTNSSYEEIARIFTTVAGNGRLMGDQLNQLGSRGLNAAAELGKALGKSEEEIRKMTSKGQIDFKTFSEAMDNAFGEHAKDANRTFNGVISNIRAALARIGADFVSPIVGMDSKVIKMFQNIITKVDDLHKLTKPLAKDVTDFLLNVAEIWGEKISKIDVSKGYERFNKVLTSILNVSKYLGKVLAPLKGAFREVFPDNFLRNKIDSLINKFYEFSKSLKFTYSTTSRLRRIFNGVFGALGIVKEFIRQLKTFLGEFFSFNGAIKSFGNGVLDVLAKLGDKIHAFFVKVKTEPGVFYNFFTEVYAKLREFYDKISPFTEKIKGAFYKVINWIKNFNTSKITGPDMSSFEKFVEKVKYRLSPLTKTIDKIKEALGKLGEAFKEGKPVFSKIGGFFVDAFVLLCEGLANGLSKIFEVFSGEGANGFDFLTDFINTLTTAGVGAAFLSISKKFSDGSKFFSNGMYRIFGGIQKAGPDETNFSSGFIGKINDTLLTTRRNLSLFQAELKAGVLIKIAQAIAILAGSLLIISLIDSKKLAASLGALGGLMVEMTALMTFINKIASAEFSPKTSLKFAAIGYAFTKMAIGLLVLALALKIISSIDPERLGPALIAMGLGITFMTTALTVMGKVLRRVNPKRIKQLGKSLVTVAFSLIIMALALKIIGSMEPEDLAKGLIGLAGGLSMMTLSLIAIAQSTKGYHAGKIKEVAGAILTVSFALVILGIAMRIIGTMDIDDLGKGMVGVAGGLSMMTLALIAIAQSTKGYKAGKLTEVASAILTVSAALVVLAIAYKIIGSLDVGGLGKGLVGVAGGLAAMSVALVWISKSTKGMKTGKLTEVATAILAMSGALVVMSIALKMIGGMTGGEAIQSLLVITAIFAILGLAGKFLGGLAPAIIKLAGALALLGGGILLLGLGLISLATGLTALAAFGVAGVAMLIQVVKVLLLGVLDIIASSAMAIANTIVILLQAVIKVLKAMIPDLVGDLIEIVVETLEIFAKNAGPIITALADLIINILAALTEKTPELVDAVFSFLGVLFSEIKKKFAGFNSKDLLDIVLGLGAFALLCALLAKIKTLLPSAFGALAQLGLLIGELGLIIAAFGVLNSIPGVQELVSKGGELLGEIGTAIGSFVGGIVGGIAEGVTSGLPGMAENLSSFMEKIQPFIDGASGIDSASMEGVKALAEAILILTAADILDGLTSWLTGGVDLTDFGKQLVDFAPYIRDYGSIVKGLDGAAVEASANAAKMLSDMAKNLPGSGGLAQQMFGEKSLSEFGEELVKFGPNIKKYSLLVRGLDSEAVEISASAGKILAEMAKTLPGNGGLAQKMFGEKSLSEFGAELAVFGPSIKAYADSVVGIDEGVVQNSVNAAQILVDLANKLDPSGGLKGWFSGDKNLGTFGATIKTFGDYFKEYYDCISDINVETLKGVNDELDHLIDMAKNAKDVKADAFTKFAKKLNEMGEVSLDNFISAFENCSDKVTNAINTMINIAKGALSGRDVELNGSGQNTGKKIVSGIISGMNSMRSTLISTVSSMGFSVIRTFNSSMVANDFFNLGSNVVQGLINGINSKAADAKKAGENIAKNVNEGYTKTEDMHSPSKVWYGYGRYLIAGLVNGIEKDSYLIAQAGSNLAETTNDSFRQVISNIVDAISSDVEVEPVIRPVVDLSNVQNGIATINDGFTNLDLSASINNLSLATRRVGSTFTEATNATATQPVSNNYNFTQNNYSPKALSRTEIYRQSKNLFNSAKGVARA